VRASELRAAARRVGAIRAVGLGLFLGLAARAAHLTVIDDQGHALWGRQVHSRLEIPPARGIIYDRSGAELAISVTAPSVYAIAREVDPPGQRALAEALDVPFETIATRLAGRTRFTYLARWVTAEQAERVASLGLSGVGLVAEPRRAYPAGSLAGGLLGLANIDGEGVRGIEQAEHKWLAGQRMVVPVERDGGGQLLARSLIRSADAAGGDIALTIDLGMQAAAEAALASAIEKTGARGGAIITIEPKTGEVLALAQAPAFDPNKFRSTDFSQTGAWAFDTAVEPGSTLKVFLAAAALETGAVAASERFDTDGGAVTVPGRTIRDRRDFGELDIAGMLRVSSNVAAVLIAQRVGREEHYAALKRFGFGKPTGAGLVGESAGVFRPWRDWEPLDHATIAFGQGINATPIQLAAAMAALANGGEWRPPQTVLARRIAGGPWVNEPRAAPRRAVSRETAASVLAMMKGVVSSEGTGRLAGLAGVSVAGKTGTAQKLDPVTRRYEDDYIAWFMGAIPAEAPQLVVTVALDEPQGVHGGGAVAAPLFAQVGAAQLRHLGIMTSPEPLPRPVVAPTETAIAKVTPVPPPPVARAPTRARTRTPLEIPQIGDRVFVPDFLGYSLSEVRQITAAHALKLQASGSGRAVAQQPAPGTVLAHGNRQVRVQFARKTTAKSSTRKGRQG
jgi:cell division protein FtsI (penicillin-binding protein 3)